MAVGERTAPAEHLQSVVSLAYTSSSGRRAVLEIGCCPLDHALLTNIRMKRAMTDNAGHCIRILLYSSAF
jgi:hypothetical protein